VRVRRSTWWPNFLSRGVITMQALFCSSVERRGLPLQHPDDEVPIGRPVDLLPHLKSIQHKRAWLLLTATLTAAEQSSADVGGQRQPAWCEDVYTGDCEQSVVAVAKRDAMSRHAVA